MRSVAIILVFREAGKVGRVLERFEPGSVDQICLVFDNPDDQITSEIEESIGRSKVSVSIIKNPERKGIGYAIREGYEYVLSHNFNMIIVKGDNVIVYVKECTRLSER